MSALLLLAMMLQTLLPALASTQGDTSARWVEVCAASGLKWVKLNTASDGSTPHAAGEHCVVCAATGATPEFDATRYLRPSVWHRLALSVSTDPLSSFPGHALHARAPPFLS